MAEREDPTISRVRETRHKISEECGHDPRRVIAYYIELERKKYSSQPTAPRVSGEGQPEQAHA